MITRQRFIKPYNWSTNTSSQTATVGTVLCVEFEVLEEATIDAIIIMNGATVAGNVTVGIYGPIITEETANASPVLGQSASTAVSGTSSPQIVTLTTPVFARKGRYYAAVEYDDVTNTYIRSQNLTNVQGWGQTYARSGGYGALTDPAPAMTLAGSALPQCVVRCSG